MATFGPVLGFLLAGLVGCHSGTPVGPTTYPPAISVTLSPTPAVSMELGTSQAFIATVQSTGNGNAQPVSYESSNTSVVTVAANGLACAGTWDSLTSPGVCTPGPTGVAQVIATAQGVSSAPTTVYVHQHIDQVTVQDICSVAVPPEPCSLPRQPASCQSLNVDSAPQNTVYQAHAYSRGVDITSSVGQFSWNATNSGVATFSSTVFGLQNQLNGVSLNQVVATAKAPGITPVYATVGTATSVPIDFTTCKVQSISLQLMQASSTSQTFAATVVDTVGNTIMAPASKITVPLTWSSSAPGSVSVTTAGVATGTVAGTAATIIASCTPPTCNIGLLPSQPIYPQNAEEMVVQGSGNNGTPTTADVYVGSTACGTFDNCISTVIPVTVPTNATGTAVSLPSTPNSIVPNAQGTEIYVGTNSNLLGTAGLMIIGTTTNSVSNVHSAAGKVLTVSPDGNLVILSDTVDIPNQVFIFNTVTLTSTTFLIDGATAAAFSPDSLKAYIVAGSTLYVYSKVDALRTIPLAASASDVAFLAEGAFAYLAGGSPSAITVRRTCDNGSAGTVDTSSTPSLIRALPDAAHMFAVNPPSVTVIDVSTMPSGCTPPVSDAPKTFDLGQGTFTASQLLISPDGSTAYILSPNLKNIMVFNIAGETSSSIALANNAAPLQAAITPDGTMLVVGASDGNLHVIQTGTNADTQQITFTQSFCQNGSGQPFGITCNPNLVAVKP